MIFAHLSRTYLGLKLTYLLNGLDDLYPELSLFLQGRCILRRSILLAKLCAGLQTCLSSSETVQTILTLVCSVNHSRLCSHG